MGAPILVVDDNPTNAKLLSLLLTGEGHEVRVAASASQALAVLAGWSPRLILMDVQLPDMDGLALTRKLRADPSTRGVRIVAVTAFAMRGDEDKAREAGCDDYLAKPIDTRTLPGRVLGWLGE